MSHHFRNWHVGLGAAAALVSITWIQPAPVRAQAKDDMVKRGEYLVTITHCHDCHTPWKDGPQGPAPDMSLALSGHPEAMKLPDPPKPVGPWIWSGAGSNTAFAGPWGISYAINLTPDPTGLGSWTEKMFVDAMRTGRHAGVGRPILPPMPWPNVGKMTDADLKALFAYLKSLKPIKNSAPAAVEAKMK